MKTNYTFTPTPKDEKYYLTFSGDLRSGSQFEGDRSKIESLAKKALESHIVIIDLNGVVFWDTETMNFIKSLLTNLNSRQTRAGIVGKKDSYIFNRFTEKFGTIAKPIIWAESETELLSQLG